MFSEMLPSFSVTYSFRVIFTRELFKAENPVFLNVLTAREPIKKHRVLFVIDENVQRTHPALISQIQAYARAHASSLELAGEPVVMVGGEAAKNDFSVVERLIEEISFRRIDRQSFVAVIGGGAVLDMVCFAGAVSHRGIRTIRIPTTVLSQSDSGVGVKNGINWLGMKNFVGTFVPPFAVINDSMFLDTLEHRDKIAGLAEAVKVALIRDRDFFDYLEANARELSVARPEILSRTIRHTAHLHLKHITTSGDPFEFGSARPLDFGHWAAHKLESMTRHQLRHGEAVAIGIALDSLYSVRAGFLESQAFQRIVGLLEEIGFVLWDDSLMRRDASGKPVVLEGLNEFQEHLGGPLTITLLGDIGSGFEVHEMNRGVIIECIGWLQDRFENARRQCKPVTALI